MSESNYDVLAYTSDMEASGLPRQQAEVIARGGFRVAQQHREDLLTITEFKQAMLAVDTRFDAVDTRFDAIDTRFDAIDARFDQVAERFAEVDRRFELMDLRFEQVERRFEQIERHLGRHDQRMLVLDTLKVQSTLHSFMLGLIVLVLVVPQLQAWFAPDV